MWWQREDLNYQNHRLCFSGRNVEALASQLPTPSFIYSGKRIVNNLERLKGALNRHGFKNQHTIYYAMKANRFMPILTLLKTSGLCGVDVCSPSEVDMARACGFECEDISYTGVSLSKTDFDRLSKHPNIVINCDSLYSIEQWGRLKLGTEIGIRINPDIGISRTHNNKLKYSGNMPSKFGIYREQFHQALALASSHQLKVVRIHFHAGCGYLTAELRQLEEILTASLWFIKQLPDLQWINIGGGLGVPHSESDQLLDLDAWAQTIQQVYGELSNIKLAIEPGEYIVKDAGLLLLEITFCEHKQDTLFMGVNAGFNIAPEPAFYDMPFLPVPLHETSIKQRINIVGNINEALDVWYQNIDFPAIDDQQHIALINAGAYSSSMASNHCMRGSFSEYLLL